MTELSPSDIAKDAAAAAAVKLVENGMRLGLGTGSTAAFMVRRLAEIVKRDGLQLRCAATSQATADLATVGITCPAFADYAPNLIRFFKENPDISSAAMV